MACARLTPACGLVRSPPLVAASEHAERAASASQSAKSSLLQLHSSVERLADAVSLLLAQQKQTDASLHQLVEDHRVQKAALEALQREKPQHHAPPTLPAADDGADADTSLQWATIAEQLSVLREEVRAHSASGFWTYFLYVLAVACRLWLAYCASHSLCRADSSRLCVWRFLCTGSDSDGIRTSCFEQAAAVRGRHLLCGCMDRHMPQHRPQ